MNKPSLPGNPEARLDGYLRHLVGLSWIDVPASPNGQPGPRCHTVSGFVMSVRGCWVWVTAGHICRDIQRMLTQGRRIEQIKFFDQWASPRRSDGGIPFPFEMPIPHFYDENQGIDYGVLFLYQNTQSLLEAGGVVPLDESYWLNVPARLDGFELVGIPTELVDTSVMDEGPTTLVASYVKPCIAPVQFESTPPADCLRTFPRFYGRVPGATPNGATDGDAIQNIDGLSGGPIFGLKAKNDGTFDYWLIAVQSGWFADRRLIFGCPADFLGRYIENHLKEHSR